jgi:hypothetical protein
VPVVKLAVTASEPLKVTLQSALPVQAPDQELKIAFESADAVSVTCVPWGKVALQAGGQLIPAGVLVTVPVPFPPTLTLRVSPGLNVAATDSDPLIVRVQAAFPEQAPLQPPKK